MQKLEGDGMAFIHAGGTLHRRVLQAGEVLKVDTGCIVGFEQSVHYDIEFIGELKIHFRRRRCFLCYIKRSWCCIYTIFTF